MNQDYIREKNCVIILSGYIDIYIHIRHIRLKAGLPHDRSAACVPKRISWRASAGPFWWALFYHFYQVVLEGTGEVV